VTQDLRCGARAKLAGATQTREYAAYPSKPVIYRACNVLKPSPPNLARGLGYAGLIPFVGAAVGSHLAEPVASLALVALVGYAATIVSFLGGIHWGFAFMQGPARPVRFLWGVTPSLLAWSALLLPAGAGLMLLALALVLALLVDRRVYPALGLAGWLPMRSHLTVVAVLSCAAGALAALP
jgi:hypothetical protein